MASKPWYENGLRFSCTRCGNCCRTHGAYTYVYHVEADVSAIAQHLGLAQKEFLERYCQEEDGWVSLRMDEPACPFLGEGNACAIYPVRPVQCRTWPFWDSNLRTPVAWERTCEACPGSGKGRHYVLKEIELLRGVMRI